MKIQPIIPFALVALLVLVGPIHAQDAPYTFCGDLSETDCAILRESAAAMLALESATFDMEADLTVTNVPNVPFDSLAFHLTGEGSFGADMTLMLELQRMDIAALEKMSFFTLMADWLRSVAADVTLTLDMPAELIELLAEEEQAIPEQLSLDLRMVDGVAYLNLEDVANAAPEGGVPPGWVGLDLAEFYGAILPAMLEGMTEFNMIPMMTALMQPENMAKFTSIERLPDAEMAGQTMAVFETRINYAAMLDIPEFQDMLLPMLEEEADAEAAMDALRAMYEGITLVTTQSIGLEDLLVHHTEMTMEWDLASVAEAIGEEQAAPQFAFHLVVTQEAFNAAPEVVAPEGAFMLPLQQMIPTPEKTG